MEVLKINYEVNVSDEDIDDIVATAFEGGFTYWCNAAKVVGKKLGKYTSDQISRGGKITIWVSEPFDDKDTKKCELTKPKFMKGLKMYLENPNAPYNILTYDEETNKPIVDTAEVDADVADMILQYALFGEIIYG